VPHSTYLPERMGTATVAPLSEVEAGSFQAFTLVYTAGYFGIDDTGSIKIVHRFASDMGRPQWSDPKAANFTTIEASNGAVLDLLYDPKLNIRPWDKTLMIRVMRGFLREGDTITVRFGDHRQGSPGMRVQTFVEPTFEFRVLVDAFATYNYVELPVQPTVSVVAGPPAIWKAVLPTLRRCGEVFAWASKVRTNGATLATRSMGNLYCAPVCGYEVFRKPSRCGAEITPDRSRICRSRSRATWRSKCSTPPAGRSASATHCASRLTRHCGPTGAIYTGSRRRRSVPTLRES